MACQVTHAGALGFLWVLGLGHSEPLDHRYSMGSSGEATREF